MKLGLRLQSLALVAVAEHSGIQSAIFRRPDITGMVKPTLQLSSVCDRYVARTRDYANVKCRDDCAALVRIGRDPAKDDNIAESCLEQHFVIEDGKVIPDSYCFDNWVYGHSESSDLVGYKVMKTKTPALCQTECQKDNDCVRFLWSAIGVDKTTGQCSLKNRVQVEVPLSIVYTSDKNPLNNYSADYCRSDMSRLCWDQQHTCKHCNKGLTCVWKSDSHVSGWKYCPAHDSCVVPVFDSTTTSTTGAPDKTSKTHTRRRITKRTKHHNDDHHHYNDDHHHDDDDHHHDH